MAKSRFSAFLRQLRLLVFGQAESELRQELNHSFSVQPSFDGRLSHTFNIGASDEKLLGNTFNVNGIITYSGLSHEFNTNQILASNSLSHQLNVNEINDESNLSHQFAIPASGEYSLSHQFTAGIVTYSGLEHQVNVNQISTSSGLNNQFNVENINATSSIFHYFGVTASGIDELAHQFGVTQQAIHVLEHSFNVSSILSSSLLEHQFNINELYKDSTLAHQFGIAYPGENNLGQSFGVLSDLQVSGIEHNFNIYAINTVSGIEHAFDINQIIDKVSVLSHSFGAEFLSNRELYHSFLVAYEDDSNIEHSFNVLQILKEQSISHSFEMTATRSSLSNSFSAIGVAQVTSNLSHVFTQLYDLPSFKIQHEFNTKFDLVLPPVTTITGLIDYIRDVSVDSGIDLINRFEHIFLDSISSSDPTYTPPVSSGTWHNQLATKSGLIEGDYIYGSWVLKNATHYVTTVSTPEYESDTIYLRQSWTSPVSTSGYDGYFGLNDFPLMLEGYYVESVPNPFPPFFGRQTVISGNYRVVVEDAIVPSGFTLSHDTDPLLFNDYTVSGTIKYPFETHLSISGIYLTKPNGYPGSSLKRTDTEIRLGFTNYDFSQQPTSLTWRVSVNKPFNTFDQTSSTTQFISNDLSRDFTVDPLTNGDSVKGRIIASAIGKYSTFTGIYDPALLTMSATDSVTLIGAGVATWSDFTNFDSQLDIEVIVSGLNRTRMPAAITLSYYNKNKQAKIVKLYSGISNQLEASLVLPEPVDQNTYSNNEFKVVDFTENINATEGISNKGITTYSKENKNIRGRVFIVDEIGE